MKDGANPYKRDMSEGGYDRTSNLRISCHNHPLPRSTAEDAFTYDGSQVEPYHTADGANNKSNLSMGNAESEYGTTSDMPDTSKFLVQHMKDMSSTKVREDEESLCCSVLCGVMRGCVWRSCSVLQHELTLSPLLPFSSSPLPKDQGVDLRVTNLSLGSAKIDYKTESTCGFTPYRYVTRR